MRDLIYDGGPIQAAFIANDDATALTLLNTPTEKVVVHAMVDIDVIVEAESESFAGDFIRSMNTQVALLNASAAEEDKRLAAILQVYVTQLSSDGIDLTRNKVRSKVSDALQAQGWNNNKRNRILNLGYILRSKPQVHYGRDAAQSDIDQVRRDIYEDTQRAHATNAAALFTSRMEQAAAQWDAATAAAQWVSAWEEA